MICVADGRVLDRRRIELVEPGLPTMPHHHEGQSLPIEEAVALVERVRASASSCAEAALDGLPASVGAVAIRERPALPADVAERITGYWASNRADWVMYRDAIADAAASRGWTVHEYDVKTVLAEAAAAMGLEDITAHLSAIGKDLGPPWQKDHRLAAAAAIAAQHR